MSRRYDLVIFDFDGTLADSLTWFRTALDEVVREHDLEPISAERAESLRGLPPKAIMDALKTPGWKLPFIAADVRKRAADNVDQISLYEGIEAQLHRLHAAGLDLAIVSSNGETAVREVLGPDTAGLFSQYACGAALFGKASVFRKVMKKAGVTPERTLTIGDEVRDIEAAREAGCDCAAVAWGFATRQILEESEPDYLHLKIEDISATGCAETERAESA